MSTDVSSSKCAKAHPITNTNPDASYRLFHGDCIDVMRTLTACSIDAIVCDPPYGIALDNKHFDVLGGAHEQRKWHTRWAREAIRAMKPGAYLQAFSATRTVQNLAVALQDAGFEIVGQIAWHHAQGGPHSKTTLKASHEPIVLARKPQVGTLAANRSEFGTGALEADAARVIPSATVTDSGVNMATVDLRGLEAKVREMGDTVLTHHQDCEMVPRSVAVNAKNKVCSQSDAVETRTIHLWRCVEGCPCRDLNETDRKFLREASRKTVVVGRSNYYLNLSGELRAAACSGPGAAV